MSEDEVSIINLSNGMSCLIDAEDFARLSRICWTANVLRTSSGREHVHAYGWVKERKRSVLMHRLIMDAPRGVEVDHINGDSLDNRKSNLRFANRSQNSANRKVVKAASGYKGVFRATNGKPFIVKVWVGGIDHYIGRFACPVEAARAYDAAAVRHFGSFAALNFPAEHSSIFRGA